MRYTNLSAVPAPGALSPVERAQRLSDSRPQSGAAHLWHLEALQFGDLSVLAALALRT